MPLGVLVDRFHLLLGVVGQLRVDARDQLRQRAHLSAANAPDRGRDRADQPLQRAVTGDQLALQAGRVGLLQQQRLVERPLLADDLDERVLVIVAVVSIVDLLLAGAPPQAHDLVHRRDSLRARVDAGEAVRAVVDPVRVLGEVVEPLAALDVARIADKAIRLRECRRADEVRVGLHREARRDTGAALDTGDRLRDVDHRLGRDDALALGRIAVVEQPRGDPADLCPVGRLHVGDQVLDHGHVPHRLDNYWRHGTIAGRLLRFASGGGRVSGGTAIGCLVGLADLGQAGERRAAVDLHTARAADRGPARAAHRERAVVAVLGLQQAVEDRERRVELDLELLPVRPLARLGRKAAHLERVLLRLGHQRSTLPSDGRRATSAAISRSFPLAATP